MLQQAPSAVYVVAGSGERVIALLDHPSLETVHLIDNNWHALYLCELKLVALQHLSVDDYLAFIGFDTAQKDRAASFHGFKHKLSEPCRVYWEAQMTTLTQGILYCGHFERFLKAANPFIRLFLGKRFFQCFTTPKSDWRNFPSFRWAIVKRSFSYKWTYRLFGMRDIAFVSADSARSAIPKALQKSMDEDKAKHSCLFHLVFKGHLKDMPEASLPPSFQKPVLSKIKALLEEGRLSLNYHCGDALSLIKAFPYDQDKARFFSLSDLLSFADMAYMTALLEHIATIPAGASRVVFRSFVRHRLNKDLVSELRLGFGNMVDLSAEERTHFYQVYQIDF